MSKKRISTRWSIPVPQLLDNTVEQAIELGNCMTKSDFVREAVREKLASMGYKAEPFKGLLVI